MEKYEFYDVYNLNGKKVLEVGVTTKYFDMLVRGRTQMSVVKTPN